MKMHLETTARRLISSYGAGVIGVDGTDYTGSVMITGNQVLEHWFDGAPSELELRHFDPLFLDAAGAATDTGPEICLLGTGDLHVFPSFELMAALKQRGVALEVMNTRAACRTYSVLIGEERSVAAALLPIEK